MAQSRPTTTTDGAKALAREVTSLKRRVRDLELHPDAGGSTFLRVYGAGHFGQNADHNQFGSISENALVSFGSRFMEEQSGGFTYSDHPDAMNWDFSIDPAAPTQIAPLWTDHRIHAPALGLYTVSLSFNIRAQFLTERAGPISANVVFLPEGVSTYEWFWGNSNSSGVVAGSSPRPSFSCVQTLKLDPGDPFWVEVMIYNKDATDGEDRTQNVWLYNVSLTMDRQ